MSPANRFQMQVDSQGRKPKRRTVIRDWGRVPVVNQRRQARQSELRYQFQVVDFDESNSYFVSLGVDIFQFSQGGCTLRLVIV